MKYAFFFILFLNSWYVFAHRGCGTNHIHEIQLREFPINKDKNSSLYSTAKTLNSQLNSMRVDENITINIPVVFHILWNKDVENISDEKIHQQLERLNKDFNAINEDLVDVPVPFKPYVGKLNINFVLANRDPLGNVTSGITRTKTYKTSFSADSNAIKNPDAGGIANWDPNSYLNIWVGNIRSESIGGLLGYAAFPMYAGTVIDGVVLNYEYVGNNSKRDYNLGRTATHEVGHYFGLRHIWGDEENCTADDGISDTPQQFTKSSGTPSFPLRDACTKQNGVMFMNYMDYSYDESLIMFTKGQSDRMMSVLRGPRKSLAFSKGYIPNTLVDLAALEVNSPNAISCNGQFVPSIKIVSLGNQRVNQFKVSYQINAGAIVTKDFNYALSLYNTRDVFFDEITLDSGSYTIKYWVNVVGENVDENPLNDTIQKSFVVRVENYSLPFTEGFERDNLIANGFQIINPDGNITWKRSGYKESTVGNYSLMMNNFDYDIFRYQIDLGEKDDLILPYLNFEDQESVSMSFSIAAAQLTNLNTAENGWDSLQVLVSTDCGQTFDVVYNKYAKDLVTVPVQETFFKPKSNQWRNESINLNSYAGYKDVIVKIRNISYWENNIYIDDLKIEGSKVISVRNYIDKGFINVFPNPSNGNFTIQMNESQVQGLKSIQLTNIIGQNLRVINVENNKNSIHDIQITDAPKGVYVLSFVYKEGGVYTQKIIIN